MNTFDIEHSGRIVRAIRAGSQKYKIRVYQLNCIYLAYLYNHSDSSKYLNRFVLGFSVAKSSIYSNITTLTKHDLIKKVQNNVFLLTERANDICLFIDSQYNTITHV